MAMTSRGGVRGSALLPGRARERAQRQGVYGVVVAAPGYKPSEPKRLTLRAGDTVVESFLVPPEE